MTNWSNIFKPVEAELDNWRLEKRVARLWFRDDDAVERTPALEQLVAITAAHNLPLLLCVIPQATTGTMSKWLASQPHVRVCVHGWGHHNHAPAGEKSQELGAHRPAQTVLAELRNARAKLADLYGDQLSDILVPPWNRIAGDVARQLPELGFTGLSTFGSAGEADDIAGLRQINTDLDIIDWKGSRGGRDPDWLVDELARLLQRSRSHGEAPIGVLAHHLVHDDLAWQFIKHLFGATCKHPAVRWSAADDLIE